MTEINGTDLTAEQAVNIAVNSDMRTKFIRKFGLIEYRCSHGCFLFALINFRSQQFSVCRQHVVVSPSERAGARPLDEVEVGEVETEPDGFMTHYGLPVVLAEGGHYIAEDFVDHGISFSVAKGAAKRCQEWVVKPYGEKSSANEVYFPNCKHGGITVVNSLPSWSATGEMHPVSLIADGHEAGTWSSGDRTLYVQVN